MKRIKINKIKEIIRKELKELEIKRMNKIKELEEMEVELIELKVKVIIERMKEDLGKLENKNIRI